MENMEDESRVNDDNLPNREVNGYISKMYFNNGKTIDIQKDSIVIFVGPNNAGKSQSLKDIYILSEQKTPTTVISDIEITKEEGKLSLLLDHVAKGIERGEWINYEFMEREYTLYKNTADKQFLSEQYYGAYRDLLVANLDTTARLTICYPPNNIGRNEPRRHPIQYAAFNAECRKWLSECYKKAFGTDITPNAQFGGIIPLCIGDDVKLNGSFENEQTRLEAYAAILEKYKQAHEQGDGIKSFVGILLYLMLNNYHTYLIDEPESFLHPPQARIMGQIIGKTVKDKKQAFISTHSEDIIKGLMETCPDRIKIIRITRENDINAFSSLDNGMFNIVWNDPLLKYSNIMSSLFHKSVVLCESDSDCKMYSIVEDYNKQSTGKYAEALFIHCGGKHRMAKIARALHTLDIDVHLIPDIDVLNNKEVFKGITEAFGVDWNIIEHDYNILISDMNSSSERIKREEAKTNIDRILSRSRDLYISERDLADIRSVVKSTSKWATIKETGVLGLPAGNATAAYKRIEKVLKEKKIHIVPVGQLEGFVKEVGHHGPEWVNKVLETYPDISSDVYTDIRQFVEEMKL